ncbi:MAG: glycosyltransferase family 9 protein [Pseudomonadota bacterium]
MSLLSSPPSSICVVRLSAIGDTCHALAVVRRLQDNWPKARITWVIGTLESSLMSGLDGVEFITFDKRAGRRARLALREQLAERRFDVALCMHASMRTNRLLSSIHAPIRLGFDRERARDFQWLYTNARIPAASHEHAMDAMMGFARAIGATETPLRWDVPLGVADRDFARGLRDEGRPLVAISPCSSARQRNFRNWPVAHFVEICRHLVEQRGARVVLTGGPSSLEREYGQAISASVDVDNRVGTTSLKQLLAIIDEADALICPDSGPAHMATTVSTPVIGLYATSNPARTGPYGSQATTVNRYPDALRRFMGKSEDEVRWGQRVRDKRAMELITIDDVRDKIDTVLDR